MRRNKETDGDGWDGEYFPRRVIKSRDKGESTRSVMKCEFCQRWYNIEEGCDCELDEVHHQP
jgi:uncharacterized protein YbaR (Trm112 family)